GLAICVRRPFFGRLWTKNYVCPASRARANPPLPAILFDHPPRLLHVQQRLVGPAWYGLYAPRAASRHGVRSDACRSRLWASVHPSGHAAHCRYRSFDAACTPNWVREHQARPLAADLECRVGNSFGGVEAANDKGERIDPVKRLVAGMALPKLKMEVGNSHA